MTTDIIADNQISLLSSVTRTLCPSVAAYIIILDKGIVGGGVRGLG